MCVYIFLFTPGVIALALVFFLSIKRNGLHTPALVCGILSSTLPILAEYMYCSSAGVSFVYYVLSGLPVIFSASALYFSVAYAIVKGAANLIGARGRKKLDAPPVVPSGGILLTEAPTVDSGAPTPLEAPADMAPPQEEPTPAPRAAFGPEERDENCLDLLMRVQQEEDRRKEAGNARAPSVHKTGYLKVLSVLLGVVCLVLLAAYSHLYSEYKAAAEELAQAQERIETQKKVYNDSLAELVSLRREVGFWERNAVVVTASGEKYHHPDCSTIRGREFYIYDVDTAEWLGYEACQVCRAGVKRYTSDHRIPKEWD